MGNHANSLSDASTATPTRRAVLLGASNLTRGISTVLETAWQFCGRPLDVLVAHGHGRSYGMTSSLLTRRLPGILNSGLWSSLADRPPLPTVALITDIGNDLLYGAPVPKVVEWVTECITRLEAAGARVVMTRLPLCTVTTLPPGRFLFFRTLFVPSCRLGLDELRQRVFELDTELVRLGNERGVKLVEQQAEWYGLDPIHLQLHTWRWAWREILTGWSDDALPEPARGSLGRWLRLRFLVPQERSILGVRQRRVQPCARLPDGTQISFF